MGASHSFAERGVAEKTKKHGHAETHHHRVHHGPSPFVERRNFGLKAYKFEGFCCDATI
jgi:hypothetical protein